MSDVMSLAVRARDASRALALMSSTQRDGALETMAAALLDRGDEILSANNRDVQAAREQGVSATLVDRLALDGARLSAIADAVRAVAALPDPIGEVIGGRTLANGLRLRQVRVPLGVVAMIYEARPNVTADAASLCVKTGNAVILRGGSLAAESNRTITAVVADAAVAAGMPDACIQSVTSTSREDVEELMALHGHIDVLIPRGGAGLIRSVVEHARVPVIETGIGNCHVYVHESADPEMARRIVINAKCQRPSVCNAAESLLVDEAVYEAVLPSVLRELEENGVTIVGDEAVAALGAARVVKPATEDDWATEYLDLKISVKVVSGIDDAIAHINRYGSRHSEAIVTSDLAAAERFLAEVDAAAVYVNASTRFTDGGEFGLGAEIGISTQKLHARGPMGLHALTTSKFVVTGNGQIRG